MAYKQRIQWETLRSLDATTLNGTWQAVGTPLLQPSYICKMVNTGNELVLVSIDGTNAIDVCPGGGFWLYDESKSHAEFLPRGTQFYVQGSAALSGAIYLVTQYLEIG